MTLAEFVPISLDNNLETAGEGTVGDYKMLLNKHIIPVFGHCKIDEITVSMIKSWQKNLRLKSKLSQKSIINIRAAFSSVFRHAIEAEITDKNPIRMTRAPEKKLFVQFDNNGTAIDHKGNEIKEGLDPFTLSDVWKIVDTAEGQFKNILTLLFFTGMRTGEMVALRWEDIDWVHKSIHIQRSNNSVGKIGLPKNGKKRKVDILPPVLDALKEQFKRTGLQRGFIFLTQEGVRYTRYGILRKHHWTNVLIRSGHSYRKLYQTRHTFASIMLQQGEDLAWVSKKMLGHSEIATTLKFYADYIPEKNHKHATFLERERTNSVQVKNKVIESA